MEKILIVEDNKSLANLMSKKITSGTEFQVDIAYNMQEAKLFTRASKYFLAILDVNLPDAQNGEVIDFMLSIEQPSIVLTSNTDKLLRKEILSKNIIDYVNKGGVEDILYVISTINRLSKNRKHKVMIVDDSMVFRKQMSKMLHNLFFHVYVCAHGEEAINTLEENPDIKVILTDYHMPVMDGLELTQEVRKKYSKNDLSIFMLSSKNSEEEIALFLKRGANDFIKKPFNTEEFSCRLNNSIEALENVQTLTNHAKRDFLTGVYSKQYFVEYANEYFEIANHDGKSFALAVLGIDQLESIIKKYGNKYGEKAIVVFSEILTSSTEYRDVVSHFGDGVFVLLIQDIVEDNISAILERIRSKVKGCFVDLDGENFVDLTTSIGYSITHDNTLEDMIDTADMMQYNALNAGGNRVVG